MGVARAEGDPGPEVLARLDPDVRRWFEASFEAPTAAQRHAVRAATEGRNVLVSSPTGSGKTLAAFLTAISDLVGLAKRGALDEGVHVVYVSPLKALNNDVRRNLRIPLEGVRARCEAEGRPLPEIRIGVRTGDTPASERQAMLRKPPHVLITTPESLALVLSAPRFRTLLRTVRWVVVDEVHALAESKRGTHLAVSLERLSRLAARDPLRVGLSATIAPLEEVGAFLFGDRDGVVIDVTAEKGLDLEVHAPADPLSADVDGARESMDRRIEDVVRAHRTTLVFTNTRAGTERVTFRLRERFATVDADEEAPSVEAHHGSLSREVRLDVEERLKRGDVRCVVTSTSLELGIDVGSADCVLLLGSPKGVSRALQRVGRAGHRIGAVSRGRFLVLDRDDLVECAVIAREAAKRRVDPVRIPRNCLDVLAQQLVGMALEGPWREEDALRLVRRAHPYRDLRAEDYEATLDYLAGAGGSIPRIRRDAVDGTFDRRGRSTREVYFRNAGTIPSQSMVKVYHGASFVGELEEAFVEELDPGDVFMLNGRPWLFRHAGAMRAHVDPAPGRNPNVPRWGTETLPLPRAVAQEVARFRHAVARALAEGGEAKAAAGEVLAGLDAEAAKAVARYVADQDAFVGVPAPDEILVEEHVDDEGRRVYVFHVPGGRRANDALARAFARRLGDAKRVSVGVAASDHAFSLAVPRSLVLGARAVRALFDEDPTEALKRALAASELAKRRFRHVAERAFLLVRNVGPEPVSLGRRQVSARMLWNALRRDDPEHLVLRETWREVLEDALDLPAAAAIAADVREGRLRVRFAGNTRTPSPFAFHLVALGHDDGVLLEDRKALLRDLHERVHDRLAERGQPA